LNLSEVIAGWSSLAGKFFPFITLSISCHTLLACSVSSERSAVKLMGIPLFFVAFPFLLLIFSLFAKFFLVWLVYVLACFSFGLLCVGLSVLLGPGCGSFNNIGKFSVIVSSRESLSFSLLLEFL